MTTVSSYEGIMTKDEVIDGAMGDIRVGDDDTEGEDGGEALVDYPGESPSNRRGILRWRPAVLVMTTNVERLSGSNPTLRCLLIKPRPR
jgi:hypothetical protein